MDGKPIGARKIRCATEGCGQEGEILDRTNDGFPPHMIKRKFEQKGWEVGDSEKHDFCPTCVEKMTIERRRRRNGNKPIVVSPQLTPAQSQETTVLAPIDTNTQPPAATREDKRAIFAKLQDVYIDETKGYMAPWTDQAVAKDLGCPLAWVQAVRDENFGPARDNSEVRDMLERATTYGKQASDILAEAKRIRAEGAALVEQINALNHRAADLQRSISGLMIVADRIAKAVS